MIDTLSETETFFWLFIITAVVIGLALGLTPACMRVLERERAKRLERP